MARGVYELNIKIAGLNTARGLLVIKAPATAVVEVIGAAVTNESNATNQQLSCKFSRTADAFTGITWATDPQTPSKTDNGDQAAASTCKANQTAGSISYTANTDQSLMGYSTLSGWFYTPGPDERVTIPPSGYLVLQVVNTPTAYDADVKIVFREIG